MGNRNLKQELSARLGDYATSARLAAAATTLRGRLDHWPKYAAVTGSALAMATGASASIITGTLPVNPAHPTTTQASVRIPGTGGGTSAKLLHFNSAALNLQDQVHLKAASAGAGSSFFGALFVAGTGPGNIKFFDSGTAARIFTSHSRISAGAGHRTTTARIVKGFFATAGKSYGNFLDGKPAFAGMELQTVTALGGHNGNFNYGWLQLEYLNNGSGIPEILEALSFGIETNQNAPIFAGQTVEPTPEPGTMGLLLLASGAFGVTALRRRKETAK